MAKKSVFVWCARILTISGILWLGGQRFTAAQDPGGVVQPIPATQPTMQQLPPTQPMAPATTSYGPPPQTPPETQQQYPQQASPGLLPQPPGFNGAPPQATPAPQNPVVCADDAAEFCGSILCSPPGQFWLRADYLAWWTNGTRLPALVTTAPEGESPDLGNPNTTILYGNQTVGNDMRSGVRVTLGAWLDQCHIWSLEADYLSLGERTNEYSQSSTGDPVLGRPYYDVYDGYQSAQLVAFTDQVAGTVSVAVSSYFQSSGLLLGRNLCSCDTCAPCCPREKSCEQGCCDLPLTYGCRTDLLVGFRYYKLSDRVGIGENLLVTQPDSPDLGSTFVIQDNFETQNQFFGSEIGLRTQIYRGRWSADIMTKIAMGNNHQIIKINGTTDYTPLGGTTQSYSSGILATGSNTGIFTRDTLALIPHLSLQVGYQVNCHLRAYAGYDVLFWGSVARAADQIDLNVDPRNWPPNLSPSTDTGTPFPQVSGRTSYFWAQGVNVGAECRF
jgi:hypothetical protein